MKSWFTRLDKGWIVALILPLIGILPALHTAHVIDTGDGLFHVHRILAMTELMARGDLYPRWIPWFHLGYGYPVFNFYAPAASYLGGLLGLIGISAPLAYNLIAAACWVCGSMGMFALARRFLTGYAAILSVAIWAYAPSRLQDVWNVGNLSGFIGTALLPWLFYALARSIDAPNRRSSVLLGFVFGGVILAHQPTTVLAGLFIVPGVPLWCARLGGAGFRKRLLHTVGGLALGVGIAAIFLLPMALELGTIKVSREAEDIWSVLLTSFLPPGQLFIQPAAPDMGDLSRRLPDTMGLMSGVLGALGFVALLARRKFMLALAWGAAVLFCIFLLLDISFNFWLAVPLLDQLRFPARVLRLAVMFLALLGGASLLILPTRFRAVGAAALVAVVIGAALPTIYPSEDLIDYSTISPRDEIEYELETFSFGGTSYNEFKPVWASGTPTDAPPEIDRYATDPMQIWYVDPRLESVRIASISDGAFLVSTPQAFELRFRHFYFPGWTARVDDAPVDVYPTTDFGLLTVNIPPGEHTITLHRENTPIQHLAALLTVVSAGVGMLLALPRPKSLPVNEEGLKDTTLSPRFAGGMVVGVIGFTALNMAVIVPDTNWFRQHSPPDAPASMRTPVHITFGDAYELLGYTLDQATAVPGGSLQVTLYWRALRPLDHTYQPLIQVVNPGQTEAWATHQGFFIGANPVNHTPDYFVSDLHITHLFDDAPPYIGSITIRLIDPQTGAALRLPDGSETLTLGQRLRITAPNPPVERLLDYRLGESVELWCASVETSAEGLTVDLYWHINAAVTTPNLRVFVHALDAQGGLVEQTDAPPLSGDYALGDWLPGQTLPDRYIIPANPTVEQLAIGLYVPDGARLGVMNGTQPVPDDRILLPIEARACTG